MYTAEEKQWGMLSFIIPLVMTVFTGGHGWIAALVIYLVYKDKSKFVAYNALQALYFKIFVGVLYVIGFLLCFVLIGFVIIPIVGVLDIVLSIMAGMAANNGQIYELPVVGKMARASVGI